MGNTVPGDSIDLARMVLKIRYQQQINELQRRLESFDAINWDGVRQLFHQRLSVLQSENNASEEAFADLLRWLEDILSE